MRAAEQRFAAANARVGVEMAEYFPKLNLLGGFGWTAQSASTLGDSAGQRWRYGSTLAPNWASASPTRPGHLGWRLALLAPCLTLLILGGWYWLRPARR